MGHKVAIDAEKVREIHLSDVAAGFGKEQHVLRRLHLPLVAPADGKGRLAHSLEDARPEGGVVAALVEVEVELPLQAQHVVVGTVYPRDAGSIFVVDRGVDRASRKVFANLPYDKVLQHAVAAFGTAYDVDSALIHVPVFVGRTKTVVRVGNDGTEVENLVGDVDVILGAIPRSSHVGMVVVEGNGASHVVAFLRHEPFEAHDATLPANHILPPVKGVVNARRTVLVHDACVHVEHHLLALHIKGRGSSMGEDVHPVVVRMLLDVPESVDNTILYMDAQGGIVGNKTVPVGRCRANVLDVKERFVQSDVYHVQSSMQAHGTALDISTPNELQPQRSALGNLVAHKHKDDVACVAVDARWVVDAAWAGDKQLFVPIVRVAIGVVVADTEFPFAVSPRVVLHLQGDVHESVWQGAHSRAEVVVAQRSIGRTQLRTRFVGKELF